MKNTVTSVCFSARMAPGWRRSVKKRSACGTPQPEPQSVIRSTLTAASIARVSVRTAKGSLRSMRRNFNYGTRRADRYSESRVFPRGDSIGSGVQRGRQFPPHRQLSDNKSLGRCDGVPRPQDFLGRRGCLSPTEKGSSLPAAGSHNSGTSRVERSVGAPMRHQTDVCKTDFSPDGSRVITVTGTWLTEQLGVWGSEAVFKPADFSPDGARILTVNHDATTGAFLGCRHRSTRRCSDSPS